METPVTTATWVRWQKAYAEFRGHQRGTHQEAFVAYLLDLDERSRSGVMPTDLSRALGSGGPYRVSR